MCYTFFWCAQNENLRKRSSQMRLSIEKKPRLSSNEGHINIPLYEGLLNNYFLTKRCNHSLCKTMRGQRGQIAPALGRPLPQGPELSHFPLPSGSDGSEHPFPPGFVEQCDFPMASSAPPSAPPGADGGKPSGGSRGGPGRDGRKPGGQPRDNKRKAHYFATEATERAVPE